MIGQTMSIFKIFNDLDDFGAEFSCRLLPYSSTVCGSMQESMREKSVVDNQGAESSEQRP